MVAADFASTIAELLTDTARTSLELPHLTTGQRKQVKALVVQYPELQCESYGFGGERRLHVFKSGCKPEAKKQNLPTFDKLNCDFSAQLPVRNSFIHFEDVPADERVVQSMPHGMFSQYVQAESSRKVVNKAPIQEEVIDTHPLQTSEPEAEPMACHGDAQARSGQRSPQQALSIGALVVVEGLTKLPAFNGLSAVVQGFDEASGRYSIMIVSAEVGCQQAKIKQENLRLLMPCP